MISRVFRPRSSEGGPPVSVAGAQRSEPHRDLRKLLVCFGALYLVSAAALSAIGRPAAVPWGFLPYLAFVALPLAVATGAGLALLPESLGSRNVAVRWRFVCVAAGLGLTFAARSPVIWIPAGLAFGIATIQHWNRQKLTTAGLAWLTVALGYACVWNANYLLAATVEGRLHDATFIAIDSIAWGGTYQNVFPLWANHFVFTLLENSYVMLFPQVIVVLVVIAAMQSARGRLSLSGGPVQRVRDRFGDFRGVSGGGPANLFSPILQGRVVRDVDCATHGGYGGGVPAGAEGRRPERIRLFRRIPEPSCRCRCDPAAVHARHAMAVLDMDARDHPADPQHGGARLPLPPRCPSGIHSRMCVVSISSERRASAGATCIVGERRP